MLPSAACSGQAWGAPGAVLSVRTAAGWRCLLAAVMIAGLAFALRPLSAGQGPENWFPNADKLLHLWFFALLWCLADRARLGSAWPRALGLLLFGGAIELAQGAFTATRGMSLADVLADAAGLGLGALLMRRFSRREPQENGG